VGGVGGKDAATDNAAGKGGTPVDAALDTALPDSNTPRVDADAEAAGDASDVSTWDTPTGSDALTDVKDASSDVPNDGNRDTSASSDAKDASFDTACSEPITYYTDNDSDGFGTSLNPTISCTPPPGNKWSVLPGDCRDDLPNVKPYTMGAPNPPLYSGVGYADAGKPQGVSFDYDCSGAEEADPSNSAGGEPNCALLNCNGVGYAAVNPARTGTGIDPRCGSTTLHRCNGNILNCLVLTEVSTEPYRCR
jgi:hypothetical protein